MIKTLKFETCLYEEGNEDELIEFFAINLPERKLQISNNGNIFVDDYDGYYDILLPGNYILVINPGMFFILSKEEFNKRVV